MSRTGPAAGGGTVFDPGLQPERTALAWRRTGLALLVGALVGARILPHAVGDWAYVPAAGGVLAAVAVLALAERRYRAVHAGLTSPDGAAWTPPGGGLAALVTVLALAAGLAALVMVVATAVG